jgi:hypothetical protein
MAHLIGLAVGLFGATFAVLGYIGHAAGPTALGLLLTCAGMLALSLDGRNQLRTCTGSFGCSNACRLKRTSSAPPATCIDMRDESTSTDRTPSPAFEESVECADSCKQVPSASCRGSTGSKCFELFSSMPALHRVRCTATTSTADRI